MKLSTHSITIALVSFLTLNLLQATIMITNKTNNMITVTSSFGRNEFAQVMLYKDETAKIGHSRRSKKLEQITVIDETKKGARTIKTIKFASDDPIHSSDAHHLEYTGELRIID